MKSFLCMVSLIVFLFIFNTGETRAADEFSKVTVAIATWPGFAAGFVGKAKGYFGGLDVNFVTMDDAQARHAAFQSGQVTVMISSADVFMQERAEGIEGTIILVTDESFGADGIVAVEVDPEFGTGRLIGA